ncbi:class I SAM-dependent RNA methyltransferase [Demequina globuliformis]|uniref:class I SAM-dependent RNA methyltransferase n=1 Tax=Demequina globuliformis TaxID=676202 RepID=UPI00078628F4|nr:TRAM domain-containing protein [Demequina globuliformis]
MTDQVLELEIGAPAHGGHCVARADGRVVFVRHALPGERVKARLTEAGDDARLWRADAVEILEGASDRVDPVWPEAGAGGVGGGELSHVSLDGQLRWKQAVIDESFSRFARRDFPGRIHQAAGDESRGGLRYRTRVSATTDAEGRPAMRGHRSRELIALTSMPLATEAIERALLDMRVAAGSRIAIAEGSDGVLRTTVNGEPYNQGRRDKRSNAPRTVRQSFEVNGTTHDFKVTADGFWQVHREAPRTLAQEVLNRVGDAERVADLYAGAGLFTVPLAASGRTVVSIEADADASRAAKRNSHATPHATIVHGDVRRTLASGIGPVDAIVLDPPRSGAGAATAALMAATGAARMVYVACDPVALARDTATLAEHGYELTDATAYDLFPMTHHVEAIATFERR